MQTFYTTNEVATLYRVHPETVKRWLRDGKLQGVKAPGGIAWLIPTDALPGFVIPDEDKGEAETGTAI